VVEEEEGTIIAVDTVMADAVDADADEARTILALPIQQRNVCGNLGTHVFDYGHNSAADLMRTSWEKLVQYVGTNYGQDICNELQNKINVDIIGPVFSLKY
jgi:hypothetical protein